MVEKSDTIDWDDCWTAPTAYDEGWSNEWGGKLATTLDQFFEAVGVPATIASVGCGPATTLLDLAQTRSRSRFFGYDIATTAIERARDRRDERGVDNATFAVDGLPRLDTERTFEFVYSLSTLHYVAEAETAVESLWECVEPGGYLLLNYPTPFHRDEWAPNVVADHDEIGFGDRSEEWVRDRLRLVLDGENVLTAGRIGDLLDRDPAHVTEFGAELPGGLGEQFPMTVVRK